jgi:hypothetical protein
MILKFSLSSEWDDTNGKPVSGRIPDVEMSISFDASNFPTSTDLNDLFKRFSAAISPATPAKTRDLGNG